MGFDHPSLLFTLPSIMLPFCRKSEKARILPIISMLRSVLNGRPVLFAVLTLNSLLEWWDLCVLTVLRFWIVFLCGLLPFAFHFCSTFAFFFHTSRFYKYFVWLKMSGNKFYCLSQFGKYYNVFYWLHYCFVFIYSREEFFYVCSEKPSCNCDL